MSNFTDYRYSDLEIRVSTLEKKMMSMVRASVLEKKLLSSTQNRSVLKNWDKVAIPKGWVYPAQFSKKYKFISATMVSRIIRENPKFFDGKILEIQKKLYVDPVNVALFFETQEDLSSRLANQYRNWREVSSDVGAISKQAKDRMSINCEVVGGLF